MKFEMDGWVDPSEKTILKVDLVETEDLRTKYPAMFSQPCEISIGKGWIPLIDRLCSMLQRTHDYNQHMGYTQVTVLQVKQKFGGLRFYYSVPEQVHLSEKTKWSDWASYVHGAVDFAESMSHSICEQCGERGKGRDHHGYYYTSCDAHKL